MRMSKLFVTLLAVLALVAAACGDDTDDAAEAPATTAAPAADDGAASDASADDADDMDTAVADTDDAGMADDDAAVVSSDDMPDDDMAPPPSGFDVDAALDADLNDCLPLPEGPAFVIGFAADLSEVGGFADIPISEAAQHYIDRINCVGGVDGLPVRFVVEDVQGNPEVSQRATADLIAAEAQVILGPPFADTGDAVLQTVEASRAVIFVASTEPVLPDPSIYSFMTTFSDTQQAEAAAQFAIDQGFTRAITFSSEGPYFGYNPETFAAKFEELGGELVLDQSYVPFEDFDFASHANEVASVADGTEILYTAMIAPQLDALRGAIEERGFDSITYFGADAFGVSGITVMPNNEGVYWTDHGFGADGNRFERLNAALAEAGMPSEAPGFAALAGDAVTMAIYGLIESGFSFDPVEIAEAIKNLSGVEAITDTLGYAGTDGTPDKPVYILQIVDGETALAAKM